MKRILIAVTSLVSAWAVVAQGSPIEFKQVPAEAKLVAHFDADAAHSSQVVQSFLQQAAKELPHAKERLGKLREKLGFEHWTDLHGLTIYSSKLAPHSGVLLVDANWNAKTLLEKAEKTHSKVVEYGKYKIYTWTLRRGRHGCHGHGWRHHWGHHNAAEHHGHQKVAGILANPHLLILAPKVELVKSALDVLDGKTANLSAGKSPLAAKVPRGTIALLRMMDLKDALAANWHPAIQVIDSFSYDKGEHDGHWFWDLKVTADSNSAAQNVALIFKGFKGWLSLHAHKAPWFIDLLDKAKLNVEGNSVDASFNQPVAAVTSVMPKIVQSIREHLKMFATMRHGHFDKTMEWKHSIPREIGDRAG